jgi:hypothetical protein
VIRAHVVILVCLFACGRSAVPAKDVMSPEPVAEMKRYLAAAKAESATHVEAETLASRSDVDALASAHPDARWSGLSDEERFFLYELSAGARAAATSDDLARAYCAGLIAVGADWWGVPGPPSSGLPARAVAVGRAVAPCLQPLLAATSPLRYHDGESNALSRGNQWVLGDLAAALAAAVLAQPFDPEQPADARANRRAELAAALAALD